MTLHNKKTQLLSNDHDNDAGIDDIFSQYGSGDEQTVDESVKVVDAENSKPEPEVLPEPEKGPVDIPQKNIPEIEDVISNLNEGVEVEIPDDSKLKASTVEKEKVLEKKSDIKSWEKEVEGSEKKQEVTNIKEDAEPKDEKNDDSKVDSQKQELEKEKEENPVEQKTGKVEKIKKSKKPQDRIVSEVIVAIPPKKDDIEGVTEKDPVKTPAKKSFVEDLKNSEEVFEIHVDPSKKTIAIVDDDLDTLAMYAEVFENADYNVIRAHDGLEALSLINDHTPHLIFTGIIMPRMDGFSMMEALKQNTRTAEIPVVINSHLGRDADRKKAEDLGAKDFIVRGFTSPREALERIGALLLRSEYIFRFNHRDPEAVKLAKDLGARNFYTCPRGQEMVIKLSVNDPADLKFSARFSCVDEKKDK